MRNTCYNVMILNDLKSFHIKQIYTDVILFSTATFKRVYRNGTCSEMNSFNCVYARKF